MGFKVDTAGPSNWLAKAINQNKVPDPESFAKAQESRFNQMEDEGWDE